MKITSTKHTEFQPITLELVIESKAELAHLWACFNSSLSTLMSNARDFPNIKSMVDSLASSSIDPSLELFREINRHAKEAGLF